MTLHSCPLESASLGQKVDVDLKPACGLFKHTGELRCLSPDPQGLCGRPEHENYHQTQESNPRLAGLEASALTPKSN